MNNVKIIKTRACIRCKVGIKVKTLKNKYCNPCAVIMQKEKSNDWLRENRRRDYDLFCLQCNDPLPNIAGGRMYCPKCAQARNRIKRLEYLKNQKIRIKLKKFYKNIQINLIQTPYLIDRKEIELII